MIRAEISVKGRVQKAGYRDLVDEKAFMRGLKGRVENKADGTVAVECEGPKDAIEALVEDIRIQKFPIYVEDIEVKFHKDLKGFSEFTVVREEGENELYERLDMGAYYLRDVSEGIDNLGKDLGGKIDAFSTTTTDHFNSLDSKYHIVSESLLKIAENNEKTSENLDRLVGLMEMLMKERQGEK